MKDMRMHQNGHVFPIGGCTERSPISETQRCFCYSAHKPGFLYMVASSSGLALKAGEISGSHSFQGGPQLGMWLNEPAIFMNPRGGCQRSDKTLCCLGVGGWL